MSAYIYEPTGASGGLDLSHFYNLLYLESYPPLPLNSRGPQGKHMQSFVAFVFALVSTERAYNIPVDLDLEGLT